MAVAREEFSSRLGFILAASGSAVGLGNIWGFPTQAASNGGAAFLLVYLIMTFTLAYPALMAELIIGRHAKANAVAALSSISNGSVTRNIGVLTGFVGIATASLILSFYAIVAGWMLAYFIAPVAESIGADAIASWLTDFSSERNVIFTLVFMGLTISIICGGVKGGIEKWSARLMPLLLVILLLLIGYVMTMDGAMEGVRAYLVPDFSQVLSIKLFVSALGQSFFSMSLGVGTMLIYGSYVSEKENISALGGAVTLVDVGIALLAGLLIIPALYVAQKNGVPIYDIAGQLIAEDRLIFTVLPALFDTMGPVGGVVAFAFFILMTIASLTSSISMLEVPVAYAVENHQMDRKFATWLLGGVITLISMAIIYNFDQLFALTVGVTTRYSQPLLGLMLCIFAGWVWHRKQLLAEIKQGFDGAEHSLFMKIWPSYVRYVCPLAILAVFIQFVLS
jgi:neurotransmitter:Na+ symporter, NSS family